MRSNKRRGRSSSSAVDPFAPDDEDVLTARIVPPTFAQQVTIPIVPASLGALPYNQALALPAVGTPPQVAGGFGMVPYASSSSDQGTDIPLNGDLLYCFGLEDEEHQQALIRVFRSHYKDGSAMMRESILFFCEGLAFSVRNATTAVEENVARVTRELQAENAAKFADLESQVAAKNEEIEQLRKDKDSDAVKITRFTEQIDMFSVNEAGLRTEVDANIKVIRAKEQEVDKLLSEVGLLRDKLAAVESASENDKARILKLEEDFQALKTEKEESDKQRDELREEMESSKQQSVAKQNEYSSLRSALDTAKQFVEDANGLCRHGGPFFNYVTNCVMECPILCNSGSIVPFKTLIEVWCMYDGYSDGAVGRTFSCANTNFFSTCVAQRTHVELIYHISKTIGVCKKPIPCVVEYLKDSEWIILMLYDTLEVLSRVCRIYRNACAGPDDKFMINGRLVFSFVLQIDEDGNRRLMISVHDYGTDLTYEGRLRFLDAEWNPFPNMIFWE